MAAFETSQTLNSTSLAGVVSTRSILNQTNDILTDFRADFDITSDFTLFNVDDIKFDNPTANGTNGTYAIRGARTGLYNGDDPVSTSWSYSGFSLATSSGTVTITGSHSGKQDEVKYDSSLNFKISKISFAGATTSWTLTGSFSYGYTYTDASGTYRETDSRTISAISSTDSAAGATLALSGGTLTYSSTTGAYSGAMTKMDLTVGTTKLAATGLKLTYADISALQFTTVTAILPDFLKGNDKLTVSSTDVPAEVLAYAGNDAVTGSTGNDRLFGGDKVSTGSGNDTLNGGDGNDYLDGQDGNDSLVGGNGNDTLYGSAGNDRLLGDLATTGATSGDDAIYGGDGDDNIWGYGGADLIEGGNGNDVIDGGDGNDTVYGGAGADRLTGGAGNDTIYALGGGKDVLTGGLGDDIFWIALEDRLASAVPSIADFKKKNFGTDKLAIYSIVDEQPKVIQSTNFLAAKGAKSALAAGQQFIYDTATGILYYDADGQVGATDSVALVQLVGKPTLEITDFI